MPITLADLTCEKCIYSADKGYRCRLHPPETHVMGLAAQSLTKEVEPDYWCGEGAWVMVAKGEYTSLRSAYRIRDVLSNSDLTYGWPDKE